MTLLKLYASWSDSVCPDVFLLCLAIDVFHKEPYDSPSRSNWTPWVKLLLGRGTYQYFKGNI